MSGIQTAAFVELLDGQDKVVESNRCSMERPISITRTPVNIPHDLLKIRMVIINGIRATMKKKLIRNGLLLPPTSRVKSSLGVGDKTGTCYLNPFDETKTR